jgi:site-specific DNA recombinase
MEYQERYGGLVLRFDTAKARFEEIKELAFDKKARGVLVVAFIAKLGRQNGLITEFEKLLWVTLVDFATVYSETDVRFTFKNGKEIAA